MPPIRARTATGAEFSFPTREEFRRAALSGRITADWEVYHARARRWLPVTVHPAYTAPPSSPAVRAPAAPRRSSDLVLIYPDLAPPAETAIAPESETDPFDSGAILAPDEIQRVLFAPRQVDQGAATTEPDTPASAPGSGHHLVEKALRTVPTLSKAFTAAAALVNGRLS